MTLGREQMWTMSHLEETLLTAAEKLPPDQACKSHSHLYKLSNHISSASSSFDRKINDVMVQVFAVIVIIREKMQKMCLTQKNINSFRIFQD